MACELCAGLGGGVTRQMPFGGDEGAFPNAVGQLQSLGDLKLCPGCGAVFRLTYEQDHDHFYPSSSETLSRLSEAEAVAALARAGPEAEAWRDTPSYRDALAALEARLTGGPPLSAEEAGTLTWHRADSADWAGVQALLSHPRAEVRAGALESAPGWLRYASASVLQALGGQLSGSAAEPLLEALAGLSVEQLAPISGAVLACLDSAEEDVRRKAADALLGALDRGARASELLPELGLAIPLLARHATLFKSAPHIAPYYGLEAAVGRSRRTADVALRLLSALASESPEAARQIRAEAERRRWFGSLGKLKDQLG